MISVEEALRILLANLPEPGVETVEFRSSLGRVLAEDLLATSDIPPFDRCAMDGYAVRAEDTRPAPVELAVAGESRAGGGMPAGLEAGSAVSIMTGAPVPPGADAVVVVEQCRRSADRRRVEILEPVGCGDNIAPRGCEARVGDPVLRKGHRVGPSEIAVMASFGHARVRVYRKPTVAILATGDELVEVDLQPRPDQIRNSNAYCLAAQLELLGFSSDYLGIALDAREDLERKITAGLQRDILIMTGGVSMGEYDLVRDVFRDLGLEILFSKVSIKPGKPTVFARKGDRLIFGLPGNPVSALTTFECFVRPALGRLCGMKRPELPRMKGTLLGDVKQVSGRTAFLPAWVFWEGEEWKVDPLPWKSSADIVGYTGANAAYIFPKHLDRLQRGDRVEIMLLPDFFVRQR